MSNFGKPSEKGKHQRQEQSDYRRMYEGVLAENKKMLSHLDETEALLTEARTVQEETQKIASDLAKKIDDAMAYNQESMSSLKTMFSTFLEVKDSFMNKPTQTAASDSNVSEMLKLLTQLARDQEKS